MSKPEQMRYFIDTCDTHAARVSMALSHVVSFYPFTASAFSTLQDDQLSFIEFMISRFTKLGMVQKQHKMGNTLWQQTCKNLSNFGLIIDRRLFNLVDFT